MHEPRRLTPDEVAEMRRRLPDVRASLACEGLRLSPQAEELFSRFDREHLPREERIERVLQLSRARRAAKANAAE